MEIDIDLELGPMPLEEPKFVEGSSVRIFYLYFTGYLGIFLEFYRHLSS
jgi:hypothetical protein